VIETAPNEVALAWWWGAHEHLLRRLDDEGWQAVWQAKARRQAAWEAELEERLRRREPQARFF